MMCQHQQQALHAVLQQQQHPHQPVTLSRKLGSAWVTRTTGIGITSRRVKSRSASHLQTNQLESSEVEFQD
jgi:hypothetical protein